MDLFSILKGEHVEAPAQLCQLEGATLNPWSTYVDIMTFIHVPELGRFKSDNLKYLTWVIN
jgi:hypothetical protein